MDAPYLIPFKAKAWLDLSRRKAAGEQIDSKNIRKHKNDVFRLAELLSMDKNLISDIPDVIKADMKEFTECMQFETVDLKQLGIPGVSKENILEILNTVYR